MPSFTNIGAYVDSGTMVDTWATVGSCAQIGKNVHLSGGVGIGGVLEPPNALPVVIEDEAIIGSRSMIVEGARVGKGAVVGVGHEPVRLYAGHRRADRRGDQQGAHPGLVRRGRRHAPARVPRRRRSGIPSVLVLKRLEPGHATTSPSSTTCCATTASMPDALPLDLFGDVRALTAALVDVESVSGGEKALADAVESALATLPHLSVVRDGEAVVARTELGHAERVVIAGHLDTVPLAGNLPSRVEGDLLYGCGTSDMKSGVAVALKLAAAVPAPGRDVTYVFYDCEEIEAARNGLARLARTRPDLLAGDFAVLMEPTGGEIEGGCQGTLRAEIVTRGRRAHSARSWHGVNAVHAAEPVLARLNAYQAREPVVDGLAYHEGLNAVGVSGGVAGNVIPDECVVTVNYRFAPDRSLEEARDHVREVFDGYEVRFTDGADGARPGLTHPVAAAFARAIGGTPRAKLGWTDVSLFSALGVPAVNYGPGDPNLAHQQGEYVSLAAIVDCERRMLAWLAPSAP